MTQELKPTSSHVLWGGAVEIHCFGRATGNWSITGTTANEAKENNHGILGRFEKLGIQYDLSKIYAPNPSRFNARVVMTEEGVDEWIPSFLYRGIYADGVVLCEPGTAFALSSADCPTVVLCNPNNGRLVAAHAGRDSLIDRSFLEKGFPSRKHQSVVDAMVDSITGWSRMCIMGFVACGIGPFAYRHPLTVGSPDYNSNLRLIDHICKRWGRACVEDCWSGTISLETIIRKQCIDQGILGSSMGSDGTCTFSDKGPLDNEALWHSHRRDDKSRNLVLVIRRY